MTQQMVVTLQEEVVHNISSVFYLNSVESQYMVWGLANLKGMIYKVAACHEYELATEQVGMMGSLANSFCP